MTCRKFFVGSYTVTMPHVQARGTGISTFSLDYDEATLTQLGTFSGISNSSYLAISHDEKMLYSVEEHAEDAGASVVALSLDADGSTLSLIARVPALGGDPCHVSLDHAGQHLFAANYQTGSFATYKLDQNGVPQLPGFKVERSGNGPNPDRQEGPHAHQCIATPDGKYVLVCDAGTDEIALYPVSNAALRSAPFQVVKTEGGSLPRHAVFARDGRYCYVVHELSCTIGIYSYTAEGLKFEADVTTLPSDFHGQSACAAIRLHPNGRFLYASNRGHDSIVAYEISTQGNELSMIGWFSTRGKTPRDFAIDPTGHYLVAANQDSHSLALFAIEQHTGALLPKGDVYETGSPTCVVFG